MKILTFVCCAVLAAGVALPVAAYAQYPLFRSFVQERETQRGRERAATQPMPQREMRPSDDEVARARMSPEERRQLRQDIQEAGKDIYRPAPPAQTEHRGRGRR